jgi:hypothetical protein
MISKSTRKSKNNPCCSKSCELLGVVTHACNPSYSGGGERRNMSSKPDKSSQALFQKQNENKRGGCVAREVEHLPRKRKQNQVDSYH